MLSETARTGAVSKIIKSNSDLILLIKSLNIGESIELKTFEDDLDGLE